VRRARRGDFERVRALLGMPVPPERPDRKRFRRLVSTLREDLYLAERDSAAPLLGLALIAYTRGLGPSTAIVRRLLASSAAEATLLLECACARAAARGCSVLELQLEAGDASVRVADMLVQNGWSEGPRSLVRRVRP